MTDTINQFISNLTHQQKNNWRALIQFMKHKASPYNHANFSNDTGNDCYNKPVCVYSYAYQAKLVSFMHTEQFFCGTWTNILNDHSEMDSVFGNDALEVVFKTDSYFHKYMKSRLSRHSFEGLTNNYYYSREVAETLQTFLQLSSKEESDKRYTHFAVKVIGMDSWEKIRFHPMHLSSLTSFKNMEFNNGYSAEDAKLLIKEFNTPYGPFSYILIEPEASVDTVSHTVPPNESVTKYSVHIQDLIFFFPTLEHAEVFIEMNIHEHRKYELKEHYTVTETITKEMTRIISL